jgi:predicted nucleotidyltransferase component of viral defense system
LFAPNTNSLDREFIDRTLVRSSYSYTVLVDTDYHFEVLIQQVKITRYAYPYELSKSSYRLENIPLPPLVQLCAMKLHAIQRRAKRKDYVDLAILLPKVGTSQAVQQAEKMFGGAFSSKLLASQLVYTQDIDYSEEVVRI